MQINLTMRIPFFFVHKKKHIRKKIFKPNIEYFTYPLKKIRTESLTCLIKLHSSFLYYSQRVRVGEVEKEETRNEMKLNAQII